MTALAIIRLVLQLAAFLARRAERRDIEDSILSALEKSHEKRVEDAIGARDDVLSGRVPADPDDPHRRD